MLDKLSAINDRYLEVEKLISSSNVMNDMKVYIQLSKEYKDLEPIVRAYKEYKDFCETNIGNLGSCSTTQPLPGPSVRHLIIDIMILGT